ncbi:MAG: hypothetical protein ACLFPH_05515 [Bacteroidales bacterium]
MHKKYFAQLYKVLFFCLLTIAIISCRKDRDKKDSQDKDSLQQQSVDTSSVIMKYKETVFTIPSPYQASIAIKKKGIGLNSQIVAPLSNQKKFHTSFKQALNIGVYGADLGYLNLYEQHPECLSYLSVIKKLGDELGLDDAVSEEQMKRIERNINTQDSLLVFVSGIYKDFDKYLTNNNREEIGALIIAGGWIESIYILSQTIKSDNNRDLINRLGEQKYPLDNLINLLSTYYYDSDHYTHLIDALVDLAYEFDGVIYNYYYAEPDVKPDKKLTLINSRSNVVISEYHLSIITQKISDLRNQILE